MQQIRQSVSRYAIFMIIAGFIMAGSVGIFYNFSIREAVGDENEFMAATLRMIANGDLRPAYPTMLYYPLMVYVYLPFYALLLGALRLSGLFGSTQDLIDFGRLNYPMLLPLARFISVLFGAGSVYLAYAIAGRLFQNRTAALSAAWFMATSLMFFVMSHFGKAWGPQIFFILLALYQVVRFYQSDQPKLKDYLLCAFLAGVAYGIFAVGLFVFVAYMTAIYLKQSSRNPFRAFFKDRKFIISCFFLVGFYFFLYFINPYAFENNRRNLRNAFFSGKTVESTQDAPNVYGYTCGSGFWDRGNYYNRILWEYEPVLVLAFIPSAIFLFRRKRKYFYLLGLTALSYYLFITSLSITWNSGCVPRYILPAVPFMAIVSGYGAYLWLSEGQAARKIRRLIFLAAMGSLLYLPLKWDAAVIKPSTRLLAEDWVKRNADPHTGIVSLDGWVVLTPDKQAIELTKKYNADFQNQKYDYLQDLDDSRYPVPSYRFIESRYLLNISRGERPPIDYIIAGWWNRTQSAERQEQLRALGYEVEAAQAFPEGATEETEQPDIVDTMRRPLESMAGLNHTGPVIIIYKVKK